VPGEPRSGSAYIGPGQVQRLVRRFGSPGLPGAFQSDPWQPACGRASCRPTRWCTGRPRATRR